MKERRFVKGAEVRAVAESGHIDGHAAVFGEKYVLVDYPDFRVEEIIKPGAFDRAIKERQDVRALFNHDPSFLLGRTSAGTLSIKEDKRGLYFDNTPPDTQTGRDVRTLIERGDVTGCSFAFEVTAQTRREEVVDKQMIVTREIEDVNLYDVGPVTYPAYEATDVTARQVDFRGMFPNGYPEPMRKHLGDLGLPADLLRRMGSKRQMQLDMTPEEMQAMCDDMESKMETMQTAMDAMTVSMDAMETKLTGAKEALDMAEQNASAAQKEAEKAKAELVEERSRRVRIEEERALALASINTMNETWRVCAEQCSAAVGELKRRSRFW